MNAGIYPNEDRSLRESEAGGTWAVQPVMQELKPKARAAGLWNLFMPPSPGGRGAGPANLDYAPLCEIMGRSPAHAEGCVRDG